MYNSKLGEGAIQCKSHHLTSARLIIYYTHQQSNLLLNNPNNNIKNLIGEMHVDLKNFETNNLSNSTESVYTPIDNISEFDSLDDNINSINDEQVLNEYETRPMQRHRLDSNENYVLITDKIDYLNLSDNLNELVVQNKDVVLNVNDFKNASNFMNDISMEKTCL